MKLILHIDRYRLLLSLLLLTLIIQMANSDTKTCWPELVGKTADEAVQVIKDESGK